MQERAPTAFFFSLLLHGTAVLAIVAIGFIAQQGTRPPMQVFELVAGPGNDYTATAAPALGTPEGTIEVKMPTPPAKREPVAAEPAPPIAPAPVKPAPVPVTAAPAAEVKTTVHAPSPKEIKRMTYQQYVKKYGLPSKAQPSSSSSAAASGRSRAVPKINARGIAEGVLGGSPNSKSGGGGHALTAAQRSELEGYIARLVTALRQNHEKPPGLSDLLAADVEFLIAADGTISRVRIARSSGNEAFDQSCIAAFRQMGSIGPKPDGKSDTWVLTFRMKDE
jgi:colicin import membrane protein